MLVNFLRNASTDFSAFYVLQFPNFLKTVCYILANLARNRVPLIGRLPPNLTTFRIISSYSVCSIFFYNREKCHKPGFQRGNIYTFCISMVLLDHFANKSNTFLFFFSLPLSLSHFLLGPSLPPIPDTRIPQLKEPWLGMIIVLFSLPSAWFLAPCINGNLALIQQAKRQR